MIINKFMRKKTGFSSHTLVLSAFFPKKISAINTPIIPQVKYANNDYKHFKVIFINYYW